MTALENGLFYTMSVWDAARDSRIEGKFYVNGARVLSKPQSFHPVEFSCCPYCHVQY
jgi:hypothetical protein